MHTHYPCAGALLVSGGSDDQAHKKTGRDQRYGKAGHPRQQKPAQAHESFRVGETVQHYFRVPDSKKMLFTAYLWKSKAKHCGDNMAPTPKPASAPPPRPMGITAKRRAGSRRGSGIAPSSESRRR